MSIAKLISSRTHLIPGRLKVSELFFDVPLDHSLPDSSRTLRIFGRSVERVEKPAAPPAEGEAGKPKQLPYFVYLQGGPGFGCAPPQDYGFTGLVLDRGFKVRCYFSILVLPLRGFGFLASGLWWGRFPYGSLFYASGLGFESVYSATCRNGGDCRTLKENPIDGFTVSFLGDLSCDAGD